MRRGTGGPEGTVAPGYGRVADAFARALRESPRGGVALSILEGGERVVDLWGGSAGARPWTRDTATVVFSCSKGMLSALVARLVEQGRMDLDDRVADHWPEFAAAGKDRVSIRTVMAHGAGLSSPVVDVTTEDLLAWDPVISALAAQRPLWTPGSGWAYHALTFGWLVGEVVRRITGRTVGEAFREEVSDPVGAEVRFGWPSDRLDEVARVASLDRATAALLAVLPGGREVQRALSLGGALPPGLVGPGTGFNDPRVQQAEVPGAGAIGTAAGLATAWSSLVVDTPRTRALDARVREDMTRPLTAGPPERGIRRLPHPVWGAGFQVDAPGRRLLGPLSFGHDGAGGQLAFADADRGIGFGFVTSDLRGIGDHRSSRILEALRTTT